MSVEETEYDAWYFMKKAYKKGRVGRIFSEAVLNNMEFDSAIDLGCGDGRLTKPIEDELAGHQFAAVDVSDAAVGLNVHDTEVVQHDLRESLKGEMGLDDSMVRFDLTICVEVAEHIKEEYVETFMDNVAGVSDDVVVFTAAPPGQSGRGHVNLQPPSYWVEKFEERGFLVDRQASKVLAHEMEYNGIRELAPWIPRNLQVYRREED